MLYLKFVPQLAGTKNQPPHEAFKQQSTPPAYRPHAWFVDKLRTLRKDFSVIP
jgi:hypothetical protein